jgi:hypothetical protein
VKNPFKGYRLYPGRVAFIVTLIAGVLIYWEYGYYKVWLVSTSPNQKYTVELTGDKGRGGIVVPSAVKYNILIGGERVISDQLVHSGDAMDISFELAYPRHAWINENTLQFWSDHHRREDNLDVLLISNNTNKLIPYLRIKARDLFFVFEVQPQSQVRLLFTHRSGPSISVEGKFADGATIDYAVGFLESRSEQPLGYCVAIDYDRVAITSPREKAYDRRGSWDNLNIEANPHCQPQAVPNSGQ